MIVTSRVSSLAILLLVLHMDGALLSETRAEEAGPKELPERVAMADWIESVDRAGAVGIVVRSLSRESPVRAVHHWIIESPAGVRLRARHVATVLKDGSWSTSCSLREPVSGFFLVHTTDRDIGARALPFSRGSSLAETDEIFERMRERPEAVIETLESNDLSVSYSAAEALAAAGDQPTMIYGMERLRREGFASSSVPEEVVEAVWFAFRANCELPGANEAEGDALCSLIRHSGLVDSLPREVRRYEELTREASGEAREGDGRVLPQHIEELFAWGELSLGERDG